MKVKIEGRRAFIFNLKIRKKDRERYGYYSKNKCTVSQDDQKAKKHRGLPVGISGGYRLYHAGPAEQKDGLLRADAAALLPEVGVRQLPGDEEPPPSPTRTASRSCCGKSARRSRRRAKSFSPRWICWQSSPPPRPSAAASASLSVRTTSPMCCRSFWRQGSSCSTLTRRSST